MGFFVCFGFFVVVVSVWGGLGWGFLFVLVGFGDFFVLFFYQITSSWLFVWHSSKQEFQTEVMNPVLHLKTPEFLLQRLLSKLVCGLDTSVKAFFFCKACWVVNIMHQDFVFNVRPVRQHRISTMISVCSLVQIDSWISKIATSRTMCAHLLLKGHLHCRLSIQLETRTHWC